MKISKITSTLTTLNLVLFISVSSIAKPVTTYEGDIIKSGVKEQITAVKSTASDITSNIASGNDLSPLRFDVNKFNIETEVVEIPSNSMDYIRFDANKYSNGNYFEISEQPSMSSIDYIRFDVNNHNNATEISEMPVEVFDYLRFDVNKYSAETSVGIDGLPVNG